MERLRRGAARLRRATMRGAARVAWSAARLLAGWAKSARVLMARPDVRRLRADSSGSRLWRLV
jgi:hypothetical protein